MKLYTFFRSSASYRVRIALNLKGLEYESIPIHFRKEGGQHRKPEFLSMNPQGLLPVLEDGSLILPQSLAILEYLDEAYVNTPLLPVDLIDKSHVRAMAQFIACDIHPLNNLRVLKYLRTELGQGKDEVNSWYRHWVSVGLEALEAMVESKGGKYCFGNSITLADVCLVPQIYNATRFDCDLSLYPNLMRIYTGLNELPAFRDAAPESQSDAE